MPEAAVAPAPAAPAAAAPAPAAAPATPPAAAAPQTPPKEAASILGPTQEAPKEAQKSAAPEKYADFKLPDGFTANKEAMDKFTPLFKEAGLSQETAQKFVDAQASFEQSLMDSQVKALEKQNADWLGDLKKEWGNDFTANVTAAAKGIEALGGPELRKFLHEAGLGNHPLLAKAFAKFGESLKEAQPGQGRGGSAEKKGDGATLYPKMKDKPDGNYRD